MLVLGIESSCDETAVAIVDENRRVHCSFVRSQIDEHSPHGGVVPEIASRCHVEALPALLDQALSASDVGWGDLDAIAVTYGPGLASSLLVGLSAAKGLCLQLEVPLIGVNHLEGHFYSVFLGENAPDPVASLPALVLLVSGGHTSLLRADTVDDLVLLGQTLDDAAGEALDKAANLLGLGYPGGPVIERTARGGDPTTIAFPRGRLDHQSGTGGLNPEYCFSFSGLKTSLRTWLERHPEAAKARVSDIAASFQEAVVDSLCERVALALKRHPEAKSLICAGGVSINKHLREKLLAVTEQQDRRLLLAEPQFCTDNAAMIAARAAAGLEPSPMDLDVCPSLSFSTDGSSA